MNQPGTRSTLLLLLAALVALFVTDLATMAGFAHGMLYVLVVLIAMLTGHKRMIILMATISTILIVLGVMLSPPAPEAFPIHYVLANRAVSILVVMAAALLAVARLHQLENRQLAEQELESTGRMLSLASEVARVGGWSLRLDPPGLH